MLARDSSNGFAMVHLGFILKTTDTDYERAVPMLKTGIATNEPGVIDGRFFFHLGDAQYRLGKVKEVRGVPDGWGLYKACWASGVWVESGRDRREIFLPSSGHSVQTR